MQARQIQSLKYQLRHFGLNPAHWLIKPIKESTYCIINIYDQSWIMQGLVNNKKSHLKWEDLQLISF